MYTRAGTDMDSNVPVAVLGGLTFQSMSAGGAHSCGMTTAGAATAGAITAAAGSDESLRAVTKSLKRAETEMTSQRIFTSYDAENRTPTHECCPARRA